MVAAVGHAQRDPGVLQGAAVEPAEQTGGLDDFGRDLDHLQPPQGMGERGTRGDAAAEADHARLLRGGMQEQRHVGEEALREHVAAAGGIHLPVHGQRERSPHPLDGHGDLRPLAVVHELSGPQLLLQPAGCGVDRVLVHAPRQQLAVPSRRPHCRERERHHDCRGPPPPMRSPASHGRRPRQRMRRRRGHQRRADPEAGKHHESRQHGPQHRADGVPGEGAGGRAADAAGILRQQLDGQRECGPEKEARRREQHEDPRELERHETVHPIGVRPHQLAHRDGQTADHANGGEAGGGGAGLRQCESGGRLSPSREGGHRGRAAERDPTDHGGEDEREGIGGRTDQEHERSRPRHFVRERPEAREREDGEDEPLTREAPRRGRGRGP